MRILSFFASAALAMAGYARGADALDIDLNPGFSPPDIFGTDYLYPDMRSNPVLVGHRGGFSPRGQGYKRPNSGGQRAHRAWKTHRASGRA